LVVLRLYSCHYRTKTGLHKEATRLWS